jgi:hypothetical protein
VTRLAATTPAVLATVAALLAGCGGSSRAPETTATEAAPAAAKRFRFVRKPIVVFAGQRPDPRSLLFRVYIRTNRALPRYGRGVRALVELDGVRDLPGLYTLSKRRHCYTTDIGGVGPLEDARDGQPVEVTLLLRLPSRLADRARVVAQRVSLKSFDSRRAERRRLRRLGCRVRR